MDLKEEDPSHELDYSAENAEQLVENSNEFDNWLNEVGFDLDNFRTASKKRDTSEVVELSGS